MTVNAQPKELYPDTEHGHVFKPGDKCFLHGMQEHPELNGEIVTISTYRQDDVHGRAYYITSDNHKVFQLYNWLYEIRMSKVHEYTLDETLVYTTTELVFGNPGERRLLPKGSPCIAKAARNLPEGNQISYWLMPTEDSDWPADVVLWANDVGCGVFETDISPVE